MFRIKLALVLVMIIAVATGGYYFHKLQSDNKRYAETNFVLEQRVGLLEARLYVLDTLFVKREEMNQELRTQVARTQTRIKREATNDKSVEDFITMPIPTGLRNVILERNTSAHESLNSSDADRRELQNPSRGDGRH